MVGLCHRTQRRSGADGGSLGCPAHAGAATDMGRRACRIQGLSGADGGGWAGHARALIAAGEGGRAGRA
eukprot:11510736-Alexandrium_andersonii.AAC.1